MILNYGVLEGADGTIDLTDFGRIDELGPVGPVPPELLPADYLARWAGFDARTRFRQANLAGDFTLVAPTLEAMYTSATDRPVDGVIQVDPQGLAAILEAVGPVTVPEVGEVTSETVVALTLNEAYFRFPDVEERSDVLGDVAEAAFRRLVDGDFPSLRPLAESIVEAVDGRHFVMHSATAAVEEAITAFGADGAYPQIDEVDTVALTAQNLAGNKLDYYLDTDLQLTGERPQGQLGTMTARAHPHQHRARRGDGAPVHLRARGQPHLGARRGAPQRRDPVPAVRIESRGCRGRRHGRAGVERDRGRPALRVVHHRRSGIGGSDGGAEPSAGATDSSELRAATRARPPRPAHHRHARHRHRGRCARWSR